jgi:hypothetical protein
MRLLTYSREDSAQTRPLNVRRLRKLQSGMICFQNAKYGRGGQVNQDNYQVCLCRDNEHFLCIADRGVEHT